MSLQQTAYSLPNFSVLPSRDRRAPYGTINNIPNILDVTSYDGQTLPVTMLSAGTLIVKPNNEIGITIALPSNADLFGFLNGKKYLSNGDVQAITIINRGDSLATFTHEEDTPSVIVAGSCDCLVIQWTIPTDNTDPYYTILPGFIPIG